MIPVGRTPGGNNETDMPAAREIDAQAAAVRSVKDTGNILSVLSIHLFA